MTDRVRWLWKNHRQLMIFLLAVALGGLAGPLFDTTFNNFLNDTFEITAETRGQLEFPREMPGFLVTVSSGLLSALPETRVAAIAAFLAALGMAGLGSLGLQSVSRALATLGSRALWRAMLGFLCTHSTGIHLGMPVNRSISLSLSRERQEGRRLGQVSAIGVAASVAGAGVVWLLLGKLGLDYRVTFFVGAAAYALSALILLLMHRTVGSERRPRLTVHKRYWIFYILSVLAGARKQVFITFGPWVLIKVYGQDASVFAVLWMIGSVAGIFFQPLIGKLVDSWGERRVLMLDAIALIFICLGYGYADLLGLGTRTIWILYMCFVLDQLLFAVSMARATYLKKIAVSVDHVASSLALGVSLDHAMSMTIPTVGGRVWDRQGRHGYRQVFAGAAVLAAITLAFAGLVRVPEREIDGTNEGTIRATRNEAREGLQ
ncbi:MAG: MFS transporter [Candidatus Zipacnadales bacterium]